MELNTYSCTLILQYERHLYYLQEMAPYDEPLRSELLGGKFTILVGARHFSFGRNLLSTDQCVYKSASNIFQMNAHMLFSLLQWAN